MHESSLQCVHSKSGGLYFSTSQQQSLSQGYALPDRPKPPLEFLGSSKAVLHNSLLERSLLYKINFSSLQLTSKGSELPPTYFYINKFMPTQMKVQLDAKTVSDPVIAAQQAISTGICINDACLLINLDPRYSYHSLCTFRTSL